MPKAQKVATFLWFEDRAEEAATFYTSLFEDAAIVSKMPGPGGKPMGVTFRLGGQEFIAFNGGPMYQLNEAVSLFVTCATQAEVDDLWEKLIADGGSPSRCGWVKDRFGLWWQIVPEVLPKLLADPDREKAGRAMQAMMQMSKIDIAALQRAYDNA